MGQQLVILLVIVLHVVKGKGFVHLSVQVGWHLRLILSIYPFVVLVGYVLEGFDDLDHFLLDYAEEQHHIALRDILAACYFLSQVLIALNRVENIFNMVDEALDFLQRVTILRLVVLKLLVCIVKSHLKIVD